MSSWLHEHLIHLAELGDGIHIPYSALKVVDHLGSVQDQSAGLVDYLGEEAVGFLLPSFPDKGMTSLVDFLGKEAVGFPFPGAIGLVIYA